MDAFIRQSASDCVAKVSSLQHVEQCMETFIQYLLHFSDLFQDQDVLDSDDYADWEASLEKHMADLLQGDVEPPGDMGMLPLKSLDPEHLRDFLGWFMLRETGDVELIHTYATILKSWAEFIHTHGWWSQNEYLGFAEILDDVIPAAMRTARLSQVLFHFVRSGTGVSPRLRGKRFSRFVEGHGRVSEITPGCLHFNFENQGENVGPVVLPQVIIALVETGDVFDVELGLRGDSWVIVDIGPVYPRCVYVEVEEYQGLKKIS
ncbi:MAG: hypothetical protein Q9M08_04340 [Mariprofundus sp.]|nr:hypothetical protein [Mariprofundus sp.]